MHCGSKVWQEFPEKRRIARLLPESSERSLLLKRKTKNEKSQHEELQKGSVSGDGRIAGQRMQKDSASSPRAERRYRRRISGPLFKVR